MSYEGILKYTDVMEAIAPFSRLLGADPEICDMGLAWWEDGAVVLWIEFNKKPDHHGRIKVSNINLNVSSEKMRQDHVYYFVQGYCATHCITFVET